MCTSRSRSRSRSRSFTPHRKGRQRRRSHASRSVHRSRSFSRSSMSISKSLSRTPLRSCSPAPVRRAGRNSHPTYSPSPEKGMIPLWTFLMSLLAHVLSFPNARGSSFLLLIQDLLPALPQYLGYLLSSYIGVQLSLTLSDSMKTLVDSYS